MSERHDDKHYRIKAGWTEPVPHWLEEVALPSAKKTICPKCGEAL